MKFSLSDIAQHADGQLKGKVPSLEINVLAIDSRKIFQGNHTLFIALSGIDRDGHQFIPDAYERGVRSFLISRESEIKSYEDVSYVIVEDVLAGLRNWASNHRKSLVNTIFIGITGSNGKTIIKEWLASLLATQYKVGKSPRSYNSQIGVPLSILNITEEDKYALIEVGIARRGEMMDQESIVKPEIGVFTNIGDAHQEGFQNMKQKIEEKARLFKGSHTIFYPKESKKINHHFRKSHPDKVLITWGTTLGSTYQFKHLGPIIEMKMKGKTHSIPFSLKLSFKENAYLSISIADYLGISHQNITKTLNEFHAFDMRLEIIQGIKNTQIINDAYILDYQSLQLSLNELERIANGNRILIISDFPTDTNHIRYREAAELIATYALNKIYVLGVKWLEYLGDKAIYFTDIKELSLSLTKNIVAYDTLLIKGSREKKLDTLIPILEKSTHSATLSIDLPNLSHNINVYKQELKQNTRFIGVLKAAAYGGGIERIAQVVESHDPAFIAVAYVEEGVQLRNLGIRSRIIVLNQDQSSIRRALESGLELEIHNFNVLNTVIQLSDLFPQIPVHIKLDTGMHRQGFRENDLIELINLLLENPHLTVSSIMSHLAGSEDRSLDEYTSLQCQKFEKWAQFIQSRYDYSIPLHILNSEGVFRFPNAQYDMVRVGIGMYGISSNRDINLKTVYTLKAKVLSIKEYEKGDTIGYGRAGILFEKTRVGVINIGYADGLIRSLGNGKGKVYAFGKMAPFIGNICMDVSMVNLNAIPSMRVGDEVEIFGTHLPIQEQAIAGGTIPYEILTHLSSRIVRKYIVD